MTVRGPEGGGEIPPKTDPPVSKQESSKVNSHVYTIVASTLKGVYQQITEFFSSVMSKLFSSEPPAELVKKDVKVGDKSPTAEKANDVGTGELDVSGKNVKQVPDSLQGAARFVYKRAKGIESSKPKEVPDSLQGPARYVYKRAMGISSSKISPNEALPKKGDSVGVALRKIPEFNVQNKVTDSFVKTFSYLLGEQDCTLTQEEKPGIKRGRAKEFKLVASPFKRKVDDGGAMSEAAFGKDDAGLHKKRDTKGLLEFSGELRFKVNALKNGNVRVTIINNGLKFSAGGRSKGIDTLEYDKSFGDIIVNKRSTPQSFS